MQFKSIAVLDLETTGLSFSRITELAIVACEREHCEIENVVPRVLHKLTICVSPQKKIHPSASELTGLDNECLQNCGEFDAGAVELVRNFLQRLPGPVCLVAHNGLKFDFPLLKREILRNNAAMLEEIYCADSLLLFREMFIKKKTSSKRTDDLSSSFEDLICLEALEQVESSINGRQPMTSLQAVNESTPNVKLKPKNLVPHKHGAPIPLSKVRRTLYEGNDEENGGTQPPSSQLVTVINLRESPKSYKLKDIFEFLHGYPPVDGHRAENDVMALLECMVKTSSVFFKWVDERAVLFSAI